MSTWRSMDFLRLPAVVVEEREAHSMSLILRMFATALMLDLALSLAARGVSAQEMLDLHNAYRTKHCVPALIWSAQLTASAQEWANGCKRDPNDPTRFAHSPDNVRPGQGE